MNTIFSLSQELEPNLVDKFIENYKYAMQNTENGVMQILNVSPIFNMSMLVLLYSYRDGGLKQSLALFFVAD